MVDTQCQRDFLIFQSLYLYNIVCQGSFYISSNTPNHVMREMQTLLVIDFKLLQASTHTLYTYSALVVLHNVSNRSLDFLMSHDDHRFLNSVLR